jgi:amidophosphoribosyltransferase
MGANLHEECGLFAVSEGHFPLDIVATCYYGLYALQHRGQEGCGMAVKSDDNISLYRDMGLVSQVFDKETLSKIPNGSMAIAHARYGTTGVNTRLNVQPLVINHKKGKMALAHNGNLVNDFELRDKFESEGSIFHTTSDSEVIAYTITKYRLQTATIEEAVVKAMDDIKGAYSICVMSHDKLIAARDPRGFRPLVIGTLEDRFIFASETCALDTIGATFLRDVEPGEVVCVIDGVLKSDKTHCNKEKKSLCVFELLYFSRPDSTIDNIPVLNARLRAGAFLSLEHPVQADVVIGVPDSGITAAIGYSRQSGIPYGIGLIKNKYIGRTFIQPQQGQRDTSVKIKLNAIKATVEGKRVVLIDDSIVRGTTSKRIVQLLRDAGAKEIHLRSSAPKFLYPCYFGTDIDSSENLLAYNYSDEQMKEMLHVDSLGFLSVDNVTKLSDQGISGFCTACFSGDYPIKSTKTKDKFRLE